MLYGDFDPCSDEDTDAPEQKDDWPSLRLPGHGSLVKGSEISTSYSQHTATNSRPKSCITSASSKPTDPSDPSFNDLLQRRGDYVYDLKTKKVVCLSSAAKDASVAENIK